MRDYLLIAVCLSWLISHISFLFLGKLLLLKWNQLQLAYIKKYNILSSFIKEFLERNPLALAHLAVAHWADCFE